VLSCYHHFDVLTVTFTHILENLN